MVLVAQNAQHEASSPPFLARENQLLGPLSRFFRQSRRNCLENRRKDLDQVSLAAKYSEKAVPTAVFPTREKGYLLGQLHRNLL